MDLQAIDPTSNKKNLPCAPNSQRRRLAPQLNQLFSTTKIGMWIVATPLWPSVGVKPNTSKVGDLESSGTPECLEFDNKAQNTSH
jgi:hypothetical protein